MDLGMTPGQYSRVEEEGDRVGGGGISYNSLFQNGPCLYEYEMTVANGGSASSTSGVRYSPELKSYKYERNKAQQKTPHRHRHHAQRQGRKNSKGDDDDSDNEDDDDDLEEDDKNTCGIWTILCCGLGLLVVVVIIILLCNYVERRTKVEKEGQKDLEMSLTYLDVQNDAYRGRISQIIQRQRHRDDRQRIESAQAGIMDSLLDSAKGILPRSNEIQLNDICEMQPSTIEGMTRDVHLNISVDMNGLMKQHEDIGAGGEWKPTDCVSRHRVAIIIPYRDRWNHLKVLLHYLLPLLKRQKIHFRIFVVEQYGNQTFNKGRIMNAAYREGLKLFNFHCVIFHDVDLVPEDDRNIYTCAEHPKHMSTAIDKFEYTLPYQNLVGGVLSFRVDHFQLVNGYSNMYWGWGGEDDDMTTRILSKGLRIFRPPNNVARYKMVKHSGRTTSPIRWKLLRTAARRGRVEGLNNVPYQLIFTHNEKLFTHFMADVGKP